MLQTLFEISMQSFSNRYLGTIQSTPSFLNLCAADHDNTGLILIGKSMAFPSPCWFCMYHQSLVKISTSQNCLSERGNVLGVVKECLWCVKRIAKYPDPDQHKKENQKNFSVPQVADPKSIACIHKPFTIYFY